MMSRNEKSADWVIGDNATIRIATMASVLFSGCRHRIELKLGRSLQYQPWMTSPEISLHFAQKPDCIPLVNPDGLLDFSPDYLGSIRNALELKGLSKHKDEHGLDVQYDMSRVQPDRALVYNSAKDLTESWPMWQRNVFNAVVRGVIPICDIASRRQNGDGFSDRHFIGYLFVSVEDTSRFPDIDLNVSFAHELAHQVLMIYEYGQNILPDYEQLVYSPIRKTIRPAIGSFHATAALSYMLAAVNGLLVNELIEERQIYLNNLYSTYRHDLTVGIEAVTPYATSMAGSAILQNIKSFEASLK